MPIVKGDMVQEHERCLPYASLSVRLLLVVCIKSCYTGAKQKGRIVEDDVRTAMATLFERMMAHLPLDPGLKQYCGVLRVVVRVVSATIGTHI